MTTLITAPNSRRTYPAPEGPARPCDLVPPPTRGPHEWRHPTDCERSDEDRGRRRAKRSETLRPAANRRDHRGAPESEPSTTPGRRAAVVEPLEDGRPWLPRRPPTRETRHLPSWNT